MLKSADPTVPPAILFNLFQSDYDIRAMTFGIRLVRRIAGQPAMSTYIAGEIQPGIAIQTDEEILQFIRERGGSDIHGVGTRRMGTDPGAVLAPRLRIKGIRNLRVVDASIMPRIGRDNTHAATVMIAEKGAEMIMQDAGR